MAGNLWKWRVAFGLLIWLVIVSRPGWTEEARLAISGYDPVAYFTDGKPVPGLVDFEYGWHNARWRFATAAHRDAFASDPQRYAPQYMTVIARWALLGPILTRIPSTLRHGRLWTVSFT